MNGLFKLAAIAAMAVLIPAAALAAEPPATTRVIVTVYHLKPGKADEWNKVYRESVTPALKKSGVPWFAVSEQLFGDRPVYTHIRPLASFAELDGPGPLERAGLTQKQRDAISAIQDDCVVSMERFIGNIQNEFAVPATGPAPIRIMQSLRAHPGKGDALRALLRSDVLPAMRQAKQAGRIGGWGVGTSAQGRPGLTAVWTDYPNLAALDAGNPMSQTMGAPAFALYQARLAQLAVVEDVTVSRYIPEMSYAATN
jgi:hypothetical protein